ncbi:MAG: HesB/IscA family protein [Microcystaceae cyanobacterium]
MIELSSSAIQEIKRMQRVRQQSDSCLRLTVKSGGCEELYYHFELWNLDPQEEDRIYLDQGVKVIVDKHSEPYLQNLRIDYAEDLLGGGFRFQNPQATTTCRCSLSFRCDPLENAV